MAGLEENEVASRNESSSRNKNGKGYCSGSFIGSIFRKVQHGNYCHFQLQVVDMYLQG